MMKQLYRNFSFTVLMACGVGSAFAQTNLLENAIGRNTADLESRDAFYSVWQLHDGNGKFVSPESAPESVFSQVGTLWSPDSQGYLNTNGEFQEGDFFIAFDYPNSDRAIDYNYNIPININAEADYALSGTVAIYKYGQDAGTLGNWINKASWVVVTADEAPCAKTMEVRADGDGKNYFSVTKASDDSKVAFVSVPVHTDRKMSCAEIDGILHLTPAHKFLSFYMPAHVMAVKDLKLTNTTEVNVTDIVAPDSTEIIPVYYDLQSGRRGSDISSLLPGIYIEKRGAEVRKISVR